MMEWPSIEAHLPPPCRSGGTRAPTSHRRGREDTPVIRKTSCVCAVACIGGVPVGTIVRMSEAGAGVAEILSAYPQLTPADCAAALNYALAHRAEIDADIAWDKASG
jgi:uncharacterized protein (DUF433 family)